MQNIMAGVFGYGREAIRVKVKKCEGILEPEYRKFSVDPQITSFEVLQSILSKAFDIRGEFTVCYRAFDDYGQETYLSLLSDWDLDAAFLGASEPCLCLQVDMKPFEESVDDWDVLGCADVVQTQVPESRPQNRLPGLILNQVEKTFSIVQRALNLVEEQQPAISEYPPRSPLTDAEFRKFLDPVGQVVQSRDLRMAIYYGGIEPSLRKVVWKHILNVYPDGMSGKERMDYMKEKTYEYQALRDCWKEMVQNGHVAGDVAYVTSMVRKDVLRTDRHHTFYAGSDDNQNIASLFNILTTYALNHPTVSYCQGMSDLASPLLVTMGNEAHAYICFCALMKRLHSNFLLDGVVMTLKFQHLAEGLLYYDPEFYAYLKSHQADDLLFCYRWLLLEMKREFAFDDALRMLEVLWSSLPPLPPQKELQLFEKQFCSLDAPILKTPRENAYTKVCALRRQSSAASLHSVVATRPVVRHRQNQSLDETSSVKGQSKVKQFSSLDDASIPMMMTQRQDSKSHCASSFGALSEPKSDETALKNRINDTTATHKIEVHSGSTGNIVIPKDGAKQYMKGLKEKFSASQSKNLFSSVDKSDGQNIMTDDTTEKRQVRVVKNLNEFLNFTTLNKNRFLPDRIVPRKKDNTLVNECNENSCSGDEDLATVTFPKEQEQLSAALMCDSKGRGGFCDGSSPDDSTEYFPMTTSMTRELRLELENLDRQVFGSRFNHRSFTLENSEDLESPGSESLCSVDRKAETDCKVSAQDQDMNSDLTVIGAEICPEPSSKPLTLKLSESWQERDKKQSSDSERNMRLNRIVHRCSPGCTIGAGEDIFVWENPLQCPATPDEQADLEYDDARSVAVSAGEIFENEGQCIKSVTPIRLLQSGVGVRGKQQSNSATSLRGDDASDSSDGWGETAPSNAQKCKSDTGQLRQRLNHETLCTVPSAMTNSCEEMTEHSIAGVSSSTQPLQLPPPSEFGGGNPFLMFLCLTVLQQHRDVVMTNGMDYNEMAMHFDKMIRKHNVTRVLNQARQMFAAYLQKQTSLNNNTVHPNSSLSV